MRLVPKCSVKAPQRAAAKTTSTGSWYLPTQVSCLGVDRETRDELRTIAGGRALVIDYFAYAARWGLRFGVQFRWLDAGTLLPDHVLFRRRFDPAQAGHDRLLDRKTSGQGNEADHRLGG